MHCYNTIRLYRPNQVAEVWIQARLKFLSGLEIQAWAQTWTSPDWVALLWRPGHAMQARAWPSLLSREVSFAFELSLETIMPVRMFEVWTVGLGLWKNRHADQTRNIYLREPPSYPVRRALIWQRNGLHLERDSRNTPFIMIENTNLVPYSQHNNLLCGLCRLTIT